MKSLHLSLFTIVLFFITNSSYSQYGIIEMENGEQYIMASPDLNVEGDELRYFIEKFERKTSVMGVGAKKLREEYNKKSRLIPINKIKKIHAQGELLIGSKSILNFNGIRYIKMKKHYEEFFIIEEGECSLMVKAEDGNAWYSYYVQTGKEEPFQLHRAGTGMGAKFRKKSKKYFANCAPAMEYIEKDLKKSTLPELIKIYNNNCIN